MASTVEDLKAAIESRGADWLIGAEMAVDGLSLTVALDHIVEVLTFLREDPACDFSTLTDITAVDWPGRAVRFEMVYHMLSMHQNHRIRVKADVPEGVMVPSVVGIWPSANWYEREVFDMYGVLFTGHPDLRRILTDYGFSGFPLRKDFPTTGYVEVRYDEEAKSVVYEPVELTQEYRQFDFMSPWEGAEYILPGDEKKEA